MNTIWAGLVPNQNEFIGSKFKPSTADDFPHATLLYMGEPKDFERYTALYEDMADAIVEEIEEVDEVRATGVRVVTFPNTNEQGYYPKVLLLESEDLVKMHNGIYNRLKDAGYESVSSFVGDNYQPHITLDWVEDQIVEQEIEPVELVFDSLVYSAGADDYPFQLGIKDYYDDWIEEEKALSRMSNNPNAVQLRKYWTVGKGGKTKIRWNTPGDFTRCVRNLRKYLVGEPEKPESVCANYHKLMTGVWPGDRRNVGVKWLENEENRTITDAIERAQKLSFIQFNEVKQRYETWLTNNHSDTIEDSNLDNEE